MFRSLVLAMATVTAIFASVAPVLGADTTDSATATAASDARRAADWRQFRGGADHRGVNRYDTELSTTTVGGLALQWLTNQGFNSSPAVANGVMYVSNGGLHAYAVDCGTGGSTCDPMWVGDSGFANWSSPAVADGVVYISGSNGLSAYAVGCRSDGGVCPRLWRDPNGQGHFSSPSVAGGMVYISTNDGKLKAYDADACRAAGGNCSPTWKADLGNTFIESSPAVADGIVYIGSPDGFLNAFKVGCGTGGATCEPIWRGNLHGTTVSSPAVGGGVVYMPSYEGVLYAFPTSCRTGGPVCEPLWKAVLPPIIHMSVAVTDTSVYVAANRRLYAFAVGCGSGGELCDPLWKSGKLVGAGRNLASSPAVANGVVYIGTQGTSGNGRLVAFPAECGAGGAICERLWRSPLLGGLVNASPAVAHGMLYVASNSGHTYAFGLD